MFEFLFLLLGVVIGFILRPLFQPIKYSDPYPKEDYMTYKYETKTCCHPECNQDNAPKKEETK